MPELKNRSEDDIAVFQEWTGDVDQIPYIDPAREKKRLENLAQLKSSSDKQTIKLDFYFQL